MSIEQIFVKERERYVQFLVETRSKLTTENPKTVGELLVSVNNDTIPYPFRYLRVDVMSSLPDGTPKPYEVKIDLDPSFEGKGFNFGSFVVEVYPFTWNSIQILFNQPIKNVQHLESWITRWLDLGDNNPANPLNLSHAIHSFTPVDQFGEWWYLTGDFGTAPYDALVEFIELLADEEMTRIVIKSGESNA